MGWANRVLSELDIAESSVVAVRDAMNKKPDLDEVCRSLAEVYDSCGPFFTTEKG